jgi:hypothetical protein
MSVMSRHGLARALGSIALLGTLGLAACGPEMQARSAAAGTSAPIGTLDDWGFGGQSAQPGYLYNQSSMGAAGPQDPRIDMAAVLASPALASASRISSISRP